MKKQNLKDNIANNRFLKHYEKYRRSCTNKLLSEKIITRKSS